ncbi:MAG: hypothetical protein LM576_05235 [Thermofilum sp.]|nr:hypothetical protein [Thermofilum sp.]
MGLASEFKLRIVFMIILMTAIVLAYLLSLDLTSSKKILVLIYDHGNIAVNTIRAKLGTITDNFIVRKDERSEMRLCQLLLNLNATLPVAILLKENEVLAVIIGVPSDNFWEQIMERINSSESAFLAFSVREELLPWRCVSCPPHGRLIEGVRGLSEKEVEGIRSIIGA